MNNGGNTSHPRMSHAPPLAPGPLPVLVKGSWAPSLVVGLRAWLGRLPPAWRCCVQGSLGQDGLLPPAPRKGHLVALCVLASGLGRLLQAVVCSSVWSLCVCSSRWRLSGARRRSGPLAPHTLTPGPSAAVVSLGEEFHMRGARGGCLWFLGTTAVFVPSVYCRAASSARASLGVCLLAHECLRVPSAVS